jgi:hypothetical protein
MSDAVGDLGRPRNERAPPLDAGHALDRAQDAADRQRAHDSIGLAGVEGHDRVARLEVGAAHEVDPPQPIGERPGEVHLAQLRGPHGRLAPLVEGVAPQLEASPPKEQQRQGPPWGARHRGAGGLEHRLGRGEALRDPTGAQKLLGGPAPQLEPSVAVRGCPLYRCTGQVDLGGLGAPTGGREGVGQLPAQARAMLLAA